MTEKKSIPLIVEKFKRMIVETTLKQFKDSEVYHPKIILQGYDGRMEIYMAPMTGETHRDVEAFKDSLTQKIRLRAIEMPAVLVATTMESWSLSSIEDHVDYKKNLKKYDWCMGNHPNAKEVLMILIESLTDQYCLRYEIKKDRTLGEEEFLENFQFTGRFKFLPSRPF